MKIKKGDNVIIVKGKDRGKKGKIIRVFPDEFSVIVEGLNIKKKHMRPKRQGEKGQVVEHPGAIAISNVKLVCSKCGKPTRVGYRLEEKRKFRVCKECGLEI